MGPLDDLIRANVRRECGPQPSETFFDGQKDGNVSVSVRLSVCLSVLHAPTHVTSTADRRRPADRHTERPVINHWRAWSTVQRINPRLLVDTR